MEAQLRADVFDTQTLRFRVNLSYGFILRNNETGRCMLAEVLYNCYCGDTQVMFFPLLS